MESDYNWFPIHNTDKILRLHKDNSIVYELVAQFCSANRIGKIGFWLVLKTTLMI